jgi:Rod binding domain-containing protein
MGTSTGFSSLGTQTTALQSREDNLIQQMKPGRAAIDDSKIEKGSKEFESILLGSWLQQAEQSFASVPGADDDEDAAQRGQMMSLGVQTVATSLAATGGIGIGKMIAKAMHAAAEKQDSQTGDSATPASGTGAESKRLQKSIENSPKL